MQIISEFCRLILANNTLKFYTPPPTLFFTWLDFFVQSTKTKYNLLYASKSFLGNLGKDFLITLLRMGLKLVTLK